MSLLWTKIHKPIPRRVLGFHQRLSFQRLAQGSSIHSPVVPTPMGSNWWGAKTSLTSSLTLYKFTQSGGVSKIDFSDEYYIVERDIENNQVLNDKEFGVRCFEAIGHRNNLQNSSEFACRFLVLKVPWPLEHISTSKFCNYVYVSSPSCQTLSSSALRYFSLNQHQGTQPPPRQTHCLLKLPTFPTNPSFSSTNFALSFSNSLICLWAHISTSAFETLFSPEVLSSSSFPSGRVWSSEWNCLFKRSRYCFSTWLCVARRTTVLSLVDLGERRRRFGFGDDWFPCWESVSLGADLVRLRGIFARARDSVKVDIWLGRLVAWGSCWIGMEVEDVGRDETAWCFSFEKSFPPWPIRGNSWTSPVNGNVSADCCGRCIDDWVFWCSGASWKGLWWDRENGSEEQWSFLLLVAPLYGKAKDCSYGFQEASW